MNLKKERQKLAMTQKEFAKMLGYNPNYYAIMERINGNEKMLRYARLKIHNYRKAFK